MFLTYFLGLYLNPEFISKGGTENKKLCLPSIKTFTLITKVPEPWGNIYSEHKVSHICNPFSPLFYTGDTKGSFKSILLVDTLTYFLVYYSVYKYLKPPLLFKLIMNKEYTANTVCLFFIYQDSVLNSFCERFSESHSCPMSSFWTQHWSASRKVIKAVTLCFWVGAISVIKGLNYLCLSPPFLLIYINIWRGRCKNKKQPLKFLFLPLNVGLFLNPEAVRCLKALELGRL